MQFVDRDDIDAFKSMLADYLITKHNITNLKDNFTCLNPNHEDKHPSMNYSSKYNICHCFGCGIRYDIFDLIGQDYGVDSFKEKIQIAQRLYPNISNIIFKKADVIESENKIDFTNYFKKCLNKINETDYLNKRKIDLKLLKKYNIGYDDKKEMVIFPINKYCYFARSVSGNSKMKSKGKSYLWNEELIKNSDKKTLIYVTESIIDSLSLETIDPNVKTVALNGVTNYGRLLEVAKEENFKGTFILVFDNDKAGEMYQNIVKDELKKININSFKADLISNFSTEEVKDLNEALIKNKDILLEKYNYFNDNYKMFVEKNNENEVDLEL